MSLKIKLPLTILGPILFVSTALGLSGYYLMKQHTYEVQKSRLEFMAKTVAGDVQHFLDLRTEQLQRILDDEGFDQVSLHNNYKMLAEHMAGYKDVFPSLSYVNKDGIEELKVVKGKISSASDHISDDFTHYQDALLKHSDDVFISPVMISRDLKTPVISMVSARYEYFGDTFMGLVAGQVPLGSMTAYLSKNIIGQSGFIAVIDSDYNIVSHHEEANLYRKITDFGEPVAEFTADIKTLNSGFMRTSFLGTDCFVAYVPVRSMKWAALVALPFEKFIEAPNRLLNTSLVIFMAVFFAGAVISVITARRIAAPILRLSSITKSVAGGDLSRRMEIRSNDELGVLAGSFSNMADELKKYRDDVTAKSEMLEKSNNDLREFAYIASHDLQEPLRKVTAFGDRLKGRFADTLGDQGMDYLERMQGAARRMQTLINGLLTYSRVTTNAVPFAPVDLNNVAKEVLSDLEVRVEELKGSVDVGDLPTIEADPLQMRQLFQNLIGNALKFNKKDEAPVVKVHGQFSKGNDYYQLTIEDNGIGFDGQYADRIFGVFQRLHGRKEYEGTGIGLSVCKKIAERHGGSIEAKSRSGEGAKFIVTLPVQQDFNASV